MWYSSTRPHKTGGWYKKRQMEVVLKETDVSRAEIRSAHSICRRMQNSFQPDKQATATIYLLFFFLSEKGSSFQPELCLTRVSPQLIVNTDSWLSSNALVGGWQRCKKRQMRQIYLCYFFSAGANFWAILGHFWANLGHFWDILGNFRSFLGNFLC